MDIFFYLFAHSIFFKNLNEFYYLRFLFFLLVFVSIIQFNDLKLFYKYLFLTTLVIFVDVILQLFLGYNLFGYQKHSDYITSFFDDEKILGTYVLKIFLLLLITALLNNRDKLINLAIYLYPVVFFIISLSGQRGAFLNSIFLFLILLIYILNKKRLSFLIGFIIFITISSQVISNNSLYNYLTYRVNFIYQNIVNPPDIIPRFTLYNYYNFEKVIFNENLKKHKYIKYEDIFGYGFIGEDKEELSISKFVKDTRLKKNLFYVCLIKKNNITRSDYCDENIKPQELNIYLNSIQNKKLTSKDYVLKIKSKNKFVHEFKDFGWYAHARIGFEIWKYNSLFGIGMKKFRDDCFKIEYKNFNSFASHFCPSHPHYYLSEILAEIGFFGFVLFSLILMSVILIISRSKLMLKKKNCFIFFCFNFFPILASFRKIFFEQ